MNLAERLLRRTPSADDIYAIARRTMERLPSPFAESLDGIVLRVEDLADMETIDRLGLDHPMDLSGLYEGVPLHLRSVEHPPGDRFDLRRRWCGSEAARLVHAKRPRVAPRRRQACPESPPTLDAFASRRFWLCTRPGAAERWPSGRRRSPGK